MQSTFDSINDIGNWLTDPTEDIKKQQIIERINSFQNDSTLLFKYLNNWVLIINENLLKFMLINDPHNITADEKIQYHMDAFYQLCKICDWKNVYKYCLTKVNNLNLILDYLSCTDTNNWKLAQFYLSWIYIILISPFNFSEYNEKIIKITEFWKSNQVLFPIIANLWATLYQKDFNLLSTHLKTNKLSNSNNNDILIWNYFVKFNKTNHFHQILQEEENIEILNELTQDLLGKKNITSNILKLYPKLVTLQRQLNNWETIEDIIDWYLNNLNIDSIDLRFALAHSFNKVIKQLGDIDLSKEIVESIINETIDLIEQNSMESINMNLLHSHLLIIAEQNKFIITHMTDMLSLITEKILNFTTNFQQLHSSSTIKGSMIKDANNFIMWSWSKEKKISFELIVGIFPSLLVNSLFDRDFLIRKSSQAALQELLGRHGSQVLNNVDIMRIIELPIHNLKESYLNNLTKLFNIFRGDGPHAFFNSILEWMIQFNIKQNFDFNIVKLSIYSIREFMKTSPNFHLDKFIENVLTRHQNRNDVDTSSRLLFLLVEINNFLSDTKKNLAVMETFHLVLKNNERRIYNLRTKESFQFLSVMKYYQFCIDNNIALIFDPERIGFYFKIMMNINDSNIWFNEFNKINYKIIEYIVTHKSECFLTDESYRKFWADYDKLLTYNKALICSSLPILPPKLLFEYYYSHKNMSCLSKSLLIKSWNKVDSAFNKVKALPQFMDLLKEFLTDYTITEQGDVGRLVRVEACQLIYLRYDFFSCEQVEETSILILKLAAESASIVRKIAHKIIVEKYKLLDTSDMSHNKVLFEYQLKLNDKAISREFWKSYSTYAGAQKYNEEDLALAIMDFLQWYEACEESVQNQTLNDIIISIPTLNEVNNDSNQVRFVITGIMFLKRIWSSRMVSGYANFNWSGVYAKLHNLTLFKGKGNKLIKEHISKLLPFLAIAWKTSGEIHKFDFSFINCLIDKLSNYIINQPEHSLLRKVASESLLQILLEFDTDEQLEYFLQMDANDNLKKINCDNLNL